MAVVEKSSKGLAARTDRIKSAADSKIVNAFLREAVGVVTVATGDSVGSKYRLTSVPSNARLSELLVSADDIGATTAADIGFYYAPVDGGAAIDPDALASALSLNAGALTQNIAQHESGIFTFDKMEKEVWEIAGLTKDPGCMIDIVATLTGAADASGTLAVKTRYVV